MKLRPSPPLVRVRVMTMVTVTIMDIVMVTVMVMVMVMVMVRVKFVIWVWVRGEPLVHMVRRYSPGSCCDKDCMGIHLPLPIGKWFVVGSPSW